MNNKIKVYMSGRNYNAEGFYNPLNGKLTVLAGSIIVREETPSLRKYYINLARMRNMLIEKGIINNYEFVEDYTFEIPFHASGVIQANGQAGGKAWKTSEGITIDEIITTNKNLEDFKNFLKNFQSDISMEKTDRIIEDFQSRFPLEKLKDLTIEEYDKTGDKNTFWI